MRDEFSIIIPRIRGRARGLLGHVAQSPCGLVVLDTTGNSAPGLNDMCAELELYARSAQITTLRIAVAATGQGHGAAEALAAISALRARRVQRIAVVWVSAFESSSVRAFTRDRAARGSVAWDKVPEGVRVGAGLASAIGSVAEVTRGIATISVGSVPHPQVQELEPVAATLADVAGVVGVDALLAGGQLAEQDRTAQLARLLVTLPATALTTPERAKIIDRLYAWILATVEARRTGDVIAPLAAAPDAMLLSHQTREQRQIRRARAISWDEALTWLDEQWEIVIDLLAARDPARAELVRAAIDARIALEGGYALGATMRAATFARPLLDDIGRKEWTSICGTILALVRPRVPHAEGPAPNDDLPELPAYGELSGR